MEINYLARDIKDGGYFYIGFDKKEDAKELIDRLYEAGEEKFEMFTANNFRKENAFNQVSRIKGYAVKAPIPILQKLIQSINLELRDNDEDSK
jgi:DNA-binding LacI/PurR family transcriptional regulator